jgi:hypothetical protein
MKCIIETLKRCFQASHCVRPRSVRVSLTSSVLEKNYFLILESHISVKFHDCLEKIRWVDGDQFWHVEISPV